MSTRNDGEKYGPGLVDALNAVADERVRQDEKWGEQNHHPFTYLAILGEEVGEANQAALQATFGGRKAWADYRTELVHTAAVAVAMIECLDRHRGAPPPDGTDRAALSAQVAKMRDVLQKLNHAGGLGFDKHAMIDLALR